MGYKAVIIDEADYARLERIAQAAGMSVQEFLKHWIAGQPCPEPIKTKDADATESPAQKPSGETALFKRKSATDEVKMYTDGACADNPRGNGGYGTIIVRGDSRQELSGGFRNTTNNRMEMYAVIKGLESLDEPAHVTVYSDSQYLVNSMTKRWVHRWRANNWMRNDTDPALNVDLWERILELCQKHKVTFQWVRGHAGHPENERCDELAVAALRQPNLPADKA